MFGFGRRKSQPSSPGDLEEILVMTEHTLSSMESRTIGQNRLLHMVRSEMDRLNIKPTAIEIEALMSQTGVAKMTMSRPGDAL